MPRYADSIFHSIHSLFSLLIDGLIESVIETRIDFCDVLYFLPSPYGNVLSEKLDVFQQHKGFALLRFRLAGRQSFTVIHPGPSGVFAARPPRIPVSLNGNLYTGWSGACGLTGGAAPTARPVVGDLIPLGRYAVCGPPGFSSPVPSGENVC